MNFAQQAILSAVAFGATACVATREIPPGVYVSQSTREKVVILQTKAHEKALLDLRLRTNETEGQKTTYRGRFNYWLGSDQTFRFYNGSSASASNLGKYEWTLHGRQLIRRSMWPQDHAAHDVFVLR